MAGGGKTSWELAVSKPFGVWFLSVAVVVIAAAFGGTYVPKPAEYPYEDKPTGLGGMAAWDGEWYSKVGAQGYDFSTRRQSSIGFFPAYPICGRVLSGLLPFPTGLGLVILSNGFFLAAVFLFAKYLEGRLQLIASAEAARVNALLCLAFLPTSLFFHMAYSESLLLLLVVAAMYGMREGWSNAVVAIIIGAATATRAVGVALLVPFFIHLWRSGRERLSAEGSRAVMRAVAGMGGLLVLACWGIIAFVGWQAYRFGEPLAFAKAPQLWHDRDSGTYAGQAVALATGEPIFAVYRRGSPCHWSRHAPHENFFLNMYFWNPIVFVGTVIVVVFGAVKGWLDGMEWSLSLALLAIPYVTVSYRMCMTSQARYASVVFPAYMVVGRLLVYAPPLVRAYLFVVSAFMMGVYSALFTSWYPVL